MLNAGFGGGICEPGRLRDIIVDRGGDVCEVVDSFPAGGPTMDCGLCFAVEERFSASDVDPFVALAPRAWPSLVDAPGFALVVLEGMDGPPGRGDCGSLVLPALFKPLLCAGPSAAVFEGVPVRAARESARAVSTSMSLSFDAFDVCPRPILLTLAPRGGIMLTGRESLLAGGGIVLLSSSMALRRTASGSVSALCLEVSLEVSDPLLLEKFSFESSSSFVSSAMAAPEAASLDGFLENWGSKLLRFARRFGSVSLLQAALAIEKWARLFIGP